MYPLTSYQFNFKGTLGVSTCGISCFAGADGGPQCFEFAEGNVLYYSFSPFYPILIYFALGPHGKNIAQAIGRNSDGSARPSLSQLAMIQHWADGSTGAQLSAKDRATRIRQELLAKYNDFRVRQTPPRRRVKEWPAAALSLGCPLKVENWPNCTYQFCQAVSHFLLTNVNLRVKALSGRRSGLRSTFPSWKSFSAARLPSLRAWAASTAAGPLLMQRKARWQMAPSPVLK